MKRTCIALMCTLGVAACGGEDRPAQSPTTTTSSTTTETTSSMPQPATTSTTSTPAAPSTGAYDPTSPRSYSQPDSTGSTGSGMGTTGTTGTTGSTATDTTDATGLPAPTTPSTSPSTSQQQQGTAGATSPDADNTKLNQRDRNSAAKTPTDQGGGNDRTITAAVRRAVVGDKSLSFTAKNVKIITTGGLVTLRGTVKSEAEKSTIEAKAKATPGVTSVDNQLDVKTK